MTVGALNSGPLNAVPFPQAEAGLSLIQLVGTVEVTATITTLVTRRVVGASTTAGASGQASFVLHQRVGSRIVPQAVCTANNIAKVTDNVATTRATAATSAGVILKRRASAVVSAAASVACAAVVKVRRSASSTCAASVSSIDSRAKVARSATVSAQATTFALLRVKISRAATVVARANSTSRITLVQRPTAIVNATGFGTVTTRNKVALGATAACSAAVTANAFRKLRIRASATPKALGSAFAGQKMQFGAVSVGAAVCGIARAGIKYRMSASAIAEAITRSAATDYGVAMPAPPERLMFVPASERSMEVTE